MGGDLHSACRVSSEYDVQPLREVISDLPFGEDAEYVNLRTVPLDFNDKECTSADADYYEVRGEYGNETVTVSRFNERSSAKEDVEYLTLNVLLQHYFSKHNNLTGFISLADIDFILAQLDKNKE